MDKKSKSTKAKKEAPLLVKILSIIYYIGAGLSVVFGLLLIVFGILLLSNPAFMELPPEAIAMGLATSFLGGVFIVIGVVLLFLAVLSFFIGRGFWKGQNWSRILVVIFSVLGALGALVSLFRGDFTSLLNLFISGAIGYYLLFSEEAKKFFS